MKHLYSEKDIEILKKNLIEKERFLTKELSVKYNSTEILYNFLNGKFEPGSIQDLTLDWNNNPIIEYKFLSIKRQTQTKGRHNMSEVLLNNDFSQPEELIKPITLSKEGFFCETSVEPSKKHPHYMIATISIESEKRNISLKNKIKVKISEESELLLQNKATEALNAVVYLLRYNFVVPAEEEEAEPNTLSLVLPDEDSENPLFGFYPELEEGDTSIVVSLNKPNEMIELANRLDSQFRTVKRIIEKDNLFVYTINDGSKEGITYVSDKDLEIYNGFFMLNNNLTSSEYLVLGSRVKGVSRTIVEEMDIKELAKLIYA